MWYAIKRGWIAVVVAAVCALPGMAMDLPPLNIPICDKPPMLDGVLNDSEWQTATEIARLYKINSDTPAPETSLRLMRDNAWLYIAADCRNPHLQHAEQLAFKHDEAVHRDDSVEIFLRPTSGAEDPYYHFILSCYGVRAERRCNALGMRDLGWNPPWRSAVQRAADGWTAEIAIPLYCLGAEDLSGLEVNIARNFMEVGLDAAGAITSQKIGHYALRPDNKGSFHSFANFQKTSGMAGFKPEVPFVPVISSADITGLVQEDGKMFYELALVLDIASSAPGAVMLQVTEDFGEGETVALSQPVELNGMLPLPLKIALNDFCQRKVKIVLADTETNSLLAGQSRCGIRHGGRFVGTGNHAPRRVRHPARFKR